MDEKKPGRLDSFTQFLRATVKRAGHMTWQGGDVEHLPDRSGHLSWQKGDTESLPRKKIKDSLGEDYSSYVPDHLQHLTKDSGPLPLHADFPHAELMNQSAHREGYNPGHYESHDAYKSWSYDINSPLRAGKHDQDTTSMSKSEHDFHVGNLDHITSLNTKHDLTLYRGLGHAFPIHQMAPGHEFIDHGYTGTSLKPQVAMGASYPILSKTGWSGQGNHGAAANMPPENYVDPDHPLAHHYSVAQIHIPAGAKGHLLDHPHFTNTGLRHEHEFLLHRGTKFRILGHSSNEHGIAHIPTHQLSVFPQHPNPKIHVVHMQAVDQS